MCNKKNMKHVVIANDGDLMTIVFCLQRVLNVSIFLIYRTRIFNVIYITSTCTIINLNLITVALTKKDANAIYLHIFTCSCYFVINISNFNNVSYSTTLLTTRLATPLP